MPKLYLDLETFSTIDLLKSGVYKYSEDVRILLFAYALDDVKVKVWDAANNLTMPSDLRSYISNDNITLVAHNSNFDRVVLEARYPELFAGKRWHDTMIVAYSHGLPGGLGLLSQIFQLPVDQAKDKEGRSLIHLFCKPEKDGTINNRSTHPDKWKKFIEYASLDIEAMRALDKKMPVWNNTNEEYELWQLDQRINGRGFRVDTDLAIAAIKAIEEEKIERDAKTAEATDNTIASATRRDAMLKYILEIHGIKLPNMQLSTLKRRLEDPDLPEPVKELIALRMDSSGTSTSKYRALINAVCKDGRLRGTLQFNGANRTGRWSGRIFQPQNLPRPVFSAEEVEEGIYHIKNGSANLIYDNVTKLASSAVRGCIIAPNGKKLVVADLSAIEGRMLAWLAGEEWKLDYYRDYDVGFNEFDVYKMTYAKTFGVEPSEVGKPERQLGKVIELFGGYGGGVGAFVTFAKSFGVSLEELADKMFDNLPDRIKHAASKFYAVSVEQKKTHGLSEKVFITCDSIKRLWREANPAVSNLWPEVEGTVRAVLSGSQDRYMVGKCRIDKKGVWLRIQLPSGRFLCYAGAKLVDDKISYLGINQYPRKWCRIFTYGGKMCISENTLVLTLAGWKAIKYITPVDLVWDGDMWVSCQGAVCNGVKQVIKAHGVFMTEDHLILTTKGWKSASQSEGYNRAPSRIPDRYKIRNVRWKEIVVDGEMRLRGNETYGGFGVKETKKERNNSFLRVYAGGEHKREAHYSRNVESPRFCGMALDVRSVQAKLASSLEKLWWTGGNSVSRMAARFCKFLERHGAWLSRGTNFRQNRQQRRVLKSKLPLGELQNSIEKHSKITEDTYPLRADFTSGTVRTYRSRDNHDLLPSIKEMYARAVSGETRLHSKVYDILNCGIKHRFTVLSEDGRPLIVHNCENITQAVSRDVLANGMILAEKAGYEIVLSIHDELVTEVPDNKEYSHEKLSALMSVVPSWATGAPLNAAGYEAYRYRKE